MMIESIETLINNKKFPSILLMFGEEEFLLDLSFEKLIKAAVIDKASNYDFETFDADEVELKHIIDSSSAYPFISEKRVIVVNHFEKFFSGKQSKKTIEKSPITFYLEKPQPTTFLILKANIDKLNGLADASKGNSKSDKAQKILKSAGFPYDIIINKYEWIEFPKVYESGYPAFISKTMKTMGKDISNEAVEMLILHTQPNLRDIYNEIEKLLIYAPNKRKVSKDDVSFVVGKSRVNNIFELQKSIGGKDLNSSLEILQNMLNSDSQEMLIMTMLTKYFIVLWRLLEETTKGLNNYQLAANVGIRPFFLNDYLAAMRLYTPEQIDNAFISLADADEKLKSSSTDKFFILQKMLISIMT